MAVADPRRHNWYNHNSKMRREGLNPISYNDYLVFLAERDRLKAERALIRQPKPPNGRYVRAYAGGTREHGVLSAKAATTDHTNFDSHALDQMVRFEGSNHYRPHWRSVGEGCWRKWRG